MRRAQGVVQLDAVDNQLLQLLADDPRMSNVLLAKRVGLTDETVAARLRKLLDVGALAMTVLIDWVTAGFPARAYARASVAHGPPADALAILTSHQAVHSVAVTTGSCDAVVGLLAPDLITLRRRFLELARQTPAVRWEPLLLVTETCKWVLTGSTLPLHGWSTELLAYSEVALDSLDLKLIDLLVTNAHESNRWLARELQVSDGTVRARLRRLESVGLLRIAAVSDVVTVGEVKSAGYVFIETQGEDQDLVTSLNAHPNVGAVERTLGTSGLMIFAIGANDTELATFLSRELRAMRGVDRIETALVVEMLCHKANLVRLL